MRRLMIAALVLGVPALAARAASSEYAISLSDGQESSFSLPFTVEHAGTVTVEAQWTGHRVIFFRIDGPGRSMSRTRTGASPVRIDIETGTQRTASSWTLAIKALPSNGDAQGVVRLTVPDAPDVVAKREAALHPPPPPPPPPPAWMRPMTAPAGAAVEIARVFDAVETLRLNVTSRADGTGDACGWQEPFLIYAAALRDQLSEGKRPDVATLRYLTRMAGAIKSVEHLRASRDRILAGPVPADPDARRDWLFARNEIVRPIERSLDDLNEQMRRGFAPSLEDERWPSRLTACITACERFFDERVRLAGAGDAPNADLAAVQWSRILAAGGVLDALGPFLPDSPAP